jgi:hypothetical protein
MSAPQLPRVVAAMSPQAHERMRRILAGCDLRFPETGPDLLRVLDDERCDMLIVGAHFDESTAVAALERVLSRPEAFPVVCVRGLRSMFGQRSLRALRMALNEMGAQNFIDLLEYPDDDAGNARVRGMLLQLIDRE